MLGFLRGDADCLVTTTIIESGLDIPTANTLIVERADQLGLSQAYQIRGRVGRSRERAFAYLLYPSAEALTEDAAARLSTLADHTELGSGFRIAMRDLDIRGAGNLLGDEQSGHVAAVGFELYCQMIDEAVAEAGGEDAESARRRRSRSASTSRSTPTCRPPSSPSRRRRSTSTAASSPPASRASCGRSATSSATASARCRRRPRTCWSCSGRGSSSASAGARSVEFRGGRLSVTGVELDSEGAGVLAEQVEGALYEWREQTASVRVAGDPEERLAAVLALADGLREASRPRRPQRPERRPAARAKQFDYAARSWERNRGRARSRKVGRVGSALALLVFGALFVVLFVVFAVAQGLGHPSVPAGDVAIVSSVPDDIGTSAKPSSSARCCSRPPQAKLKKAPQTRRQKIRRTEGSALGELLDSDLDPGRGRRTGHLGDAERDRRPNWPDQKTRTSKPKPNTRNSSKPRTSPRRTSTTG